MTGELQYLPTHSAVYFGDAFKLLKLVRPGSVRLILTDPPYNVSQINNFTTMGRRGIDFGKWDHEFDTTGWLESAAKTLMPNGSIIVWNDWKLLGFIAAHLQTLGFSVKRQLRWVKCLSGSTRIYARTKKGDAPALLKDLVRLDPSTVKLWNGENWTQVISWEKQPSPKDPVEVEFRSGEIVRCTKDHRWPTQRGLVESHELVEGDVVQTAILPEPDNVVRPSAIDDGLIGWFVGLYIAEGSRGGHKKKPKLQFSGHIEENDRHLRLQQIADDFHGTLAVHNTHGKAVSANMTGGVLHGIINDYVAGHDCYNKHLTRKAWARSDAFLRGVLLGYLDGDGSYEEKDDRHRLGFTGKNKYLANDLRTIAARIGLQIRLKRGRSTCEGKSYPTYRGEIRLSPSTPCKPDSEVIGVRPCRWAKGFWDVAVADNPHLFALASGLLTHNTNPMPRNTSSMPVQSDECALWAVKGKGWVFNKRSSAYERGDFYHPVIRGHAHPNKKPDRVFLDLVEMFSNPGELVLDPFAGAATTAVACQRAGRRHISFENDKEYYDLAVKELSDLVPVNRNN
jgi:DNA modification methylase